MALVSPVVVGPVSPCSSSVRVCGQSPGATVHVFGTTPAGLRTVAKTVAQSADEWVPLLPGIALKPKEMLTADQRTSLDSAAPVPVDSGVEVGAKPGAGDLGEMFSAETMLECGTCLWIAGICPGAEVTFRRNNEPPLVARSPSDQLKFVLPAGKSLRPADVLTVAQTACGIVGAQVSLPAPVPQPRDAWPLAGPVVALPLVRCQTRLELSGVRPGATVVIALNGAESRACFGATQGVFWLSRGLKIGDRVQVRQEFPLCELKSLTTEATVADALPPPPRVVGPICEGDRLVRVDGLFEGALVELALDGAPFCNGVAAQASSQFGVPSLIGGSALAVRQSVCGGSPGTWSDWSEQIPIAALEPQAAPALVGPLVERGVCVRVTTDPWPAVDPKPLPKGTLLQIVSRQRGVLGEAWTTGDVFVDVALWFPLLRTDHVRVRTRRCGKRHEWPTESVVGPPHDVNLPTVSDPACDCGGSVLVRNLVPGAIVDVFRNRGGQVPVLLGSGRSGGDVASVDVEPLAFGDRVHARQRMGPFASGPGAVATAPETPHWHYRDNSAFRLCQLTQDWDPTGRPHAGPTTPIGITGTDLGIPVEHGGRLYLFFGDAAAAPGIATDADPIGWVTTTDPDDLETRAPDLQWVLGGDGKFRRLALIDGPELGNFEVPTGGFSYDGQLYMFVATDRREDPILRMTASRLAVAADPTQDFRSILFISSTVGGQLPVLHPDGSVSGVPYPGGRWMLHISATVVRNADWPGLPSTTGDGLLLFGSSLYRGDPGSDRTAAEQASGNVYLAWAPLTPGTVPPAAPIPGPEHWSFLVGRKPTGEPVWDTLAAGATPMPVLSPDPWGPRFLGEISVVWYPDLRRWILAGSAPFATINLARNPWGPWSTSQNLCDAADPTRDAGNSRAGGLWNETKVSYAPYLVGRWRKWDRSIRMATVYFTLSVFDLPHDQYRYQPQLMRSSVQCGL